MKPVTDETFNNDVIIRSETVPVIVDLWAPWCEPCKVLGPILEKCVKATEGKVEFCLLYTSPSPRDPTKSRMPSSA